MIEAKIVADSKSVQGNRITSFVVTMPRIVLAELNTHRALSRNSASSRAIPFAKMLDMVKTNPFIPIKWMKEHKGMQGKDYFTDPIEIEAIKNAYLEAKDNAIMSAEKLSSLGLTKQIVNRGLEAYMWHTVIITSTDFENYFALRAHEAAEIHIQDLAYKMLDAMNESTPIELQPGQWHIPFGDNMDEEALIKFLPEDNKFIKLEDLKVKVATARCARVSYTVVGEEGKPDNYENDIKLHDKLMSMGHLSPFEHCAQAPTMWSTSNPYSGNFYGWTQYRKMLHNENRKETRLIKK